MSKQKLTKGLFRVILGIAMIVSTGAAMADVHQVSVIVNGITYQCSEGGGGGGTAIRLNPGTYLSSDGKTYEVYSVAYSGDRVRSFTLSTPSGTAPFECEYISCTFGGNWNATIVNANHLIFNGKDLARKGF